MKIGTNMKASELKNIINNLPDDAEILISTDFGPCSFDDYTVEHLNLVTHYRQYSNHYTTYSSWDYPRENQDDIERSALCLIFHP